MKFNFSINISRIQGVKNTINAWSWYRIVLLSSIVISISATIYSFMHDYIISYGDAESHLDIAKRVVSGLTPGFAQLGGIWLPLPHLLLAPLVYFDPLWRTGLAGSIVSGICYVISCLTLFKLTQLLTKSKLASVFAVAVFALNPNILYMQTTPMTELPLIVFSLLSSYFFIKFMKEENTYVFLILAAFFGFLATLSRYDAWFLVLFEGLIILLRYIRQRKNWSKMQGLFILFATPAFFGVLLWLFWDFAILGDPLYFSHSQFSANAQQHGWLQKGQLPAYKNIFISFLYYFVATMSNAGVVIFILSFFGIGQFLSNKKEKFRYFYALLLLFPFFLNIFTLYIGQTIMFLPDITPITFEWTLFNARYGVLMIPVIAFALGYLLHNISNKAKLIVIFLVLVQYALFGIGYTRVITLADGTVGLSAEKRPDAEHWLATHYDHGLVLLDDYSRITSIIKSNIPMQNVIYIGTKPYWNNSLQAPEKYATWIIMQRNDDVWNKLYKNPAMLGRVYKYYQKVYTSPDILIFKRNANGRTN